MHFCSSSPCADTDGMLSQALLVGNFEAAVDICVSSDRMVSLMFSPVRVLDTGRASLIILLETLDS